jgi:general secretion pathway protein C
VRTYSVGQQVVENVILDEIHPREVILLNKNTNQREVLRFEDSKDAVAGGAAAAPPGSKAAQQPQPPPAAAGNRVNLKKTELVQDLFMNYSDIATQVKPEPYRDPNTGNITGLTANNLESIPIAKKLGVQNGDVLQTVNNEVIDSEQKILELVQKYRNTNTFRIGILRNGKPMVITYKLE